jgi:hypothetical protein
LPKQRKNSAIYAFWAVIGAAMVLFDLNDVRGSAAAVAGHHGQHQGHSSAFQADALAPLKTVKRLSTHPWPFPAKTGASHHAVELRAAQPDSSFVT